MARETSATSVPAARKRSRLPLVLVFLCTLAPIVAAFVVYYNPQWWPDDASNYGTLVTPQRPMPAAGELTLTTLDGQPFDLQTLKGKWLLVAADGAACPESCARKLYIARNSHASQGKNVDRLARSGSSPTTRRCRTRCWRPTRARSCCAPTPASSPASCSPASSNRPRPLAAPIWIIDPLGNLMMQYPADADGVKVRKDVSKLVYNSRVG